MYLRIFILFIFSIFSSEIYSQTCSALGQSPGTAFPVCGTNSFSQNTVPICGQKLIPTPCSNQPGATFLDKNPFWYKFTCYTPGTLGFTITPNNLNDDYDWQLFDVTNHNPDDVYTDNSLFVSCNWSGRSGITGASASGSGSVNCAGTTYPLFSVMPSLLQGHNYLLLVSHYDNTQSGYGLTFGGGTASITDTVSPRLQSASINCDGTHITIKLNKKMKCSSLAPDGSDFIISSGGIISSVFGNGCSGSFDLDSVTIVLTTPLSPGNYTVSAANGTDGNTLLDNCDLSVPAGDKVGFTVTSLQPTPMDSISSVICSPATLHLVFKRPIQCSSIATNGSDFTVTGPSAVHVSAAIESCTSSGFATWIDVNLSDPILLGGTYQIHLQTGSDGNTLIDECGQQSPAGSLSFTVADTVSSLFNYQVNMGCHFDTINFFNAGANGINLWRWRVNGNLFSTQQNPQRSFPASGQYPISLFVSNGVCTDSSLINIILDNEVKAGFETNNIICPEDSASFKNTSTGKIISWLWDFGNGMISSQQTPPLQKYPPPTGGDAYYTTTLKVFGGTSCVDTASRKIRVLKSCYIAVPNAFTPNGDGLNDFLYPMNAFKADDLNFKVYNRWGQIVFETSDWTKMWNGNIKGNPAPVGIYVWTLRYTNRDTGKKYSLKGTTMLIR